VKNLSRRTFLTGLAPTAEQELDLIAKFNQEKCIAWNRNICYICKDRCPADAIKSLSGCDPIVEIDRCTGCGQCASACFIQAIAMIPKELIQKEPEKEGSNS
jgi:MinD superfamily P-loop ATPase